MTHRPDCHLTDEDLLRAADRELPAKAMSRARDHLDACEGCRSRLAEMEGSIGRFVHDYREELAPELTSATRSLALFRARLAANLSVTCESGGWKAKLARSMSSPAGVAAAIVLVLFAGALTVNRLGFAWSDNEQAAGPIEPDAVPKPSLTPGATSRVLVGDVCEGNDRKLLTDRVPSALSREVFAEYGIRNPVPGAYEVDYLITPELGGSAELKNLWPEPYFDIEWNARVKDALEIRLHKLVCRGDLGLQTAQQDLANNWVVAYRKYFHSNRPLPDRAAAVASREETGPMQPFEEAKALARFQIPLLQFQ